MDAERGPDKPYDKLLALLDECLAWDEVDRVWLKKGILRAASIVTQND